MASDSEDQTPWIPDEHVNACSVCHVEFTVYNRRHHCRACGNVVCGACSAHRIELKSGPAEATVWTNDLTHDYVHENSAYAS